MANVQVISERTQRFGGLNLIFQSKEYKKILEPCDNELGVRSPSGGGYSYSEVINALFLSVLSGGTCVEDVNLLVPELSQSPHIKAPSADSVLRTLEKLSVDDEPVKAKGSGINYTFNRNSKLNELLVKGAVEAGLLERGKACDFDYDNQIIRTRKRDSAWTYKKDVMGYAPGIAFANGHPISIEGRGGNAPVIFDQARTLRLAYEALLMEGVKVNRSRMDAGSYSREVISVVEEYSDLFYICAKVLEVSKRSGRLVNSKARLKKFIHYFVTCPARWVKSRTGGVLQLFGATVLQRWYVEQMCDG